MNITVPRWTLWIMLITGILGILFLLSDLAR